MPEAAQKKFADYVCLLRQCALFKEIAADDLLAMLNCLQAKMCYFEKAEQIYGQGQNVRDVGIVLAGSAFIEKLDCWGNRSIIAKVLPGDMFGEALSCVEAEQTPINVVATDKTTVMFINYKKIISTCSAACTFHTGLIENMLRILAYKNIMLTNKIDHLTRRTTREKLLSYLSAQALQAGQRTFDIPLSRQELADYLAVERSAMSNELGKLRDEGILEFNKNHFVLHEIAAD